MKDMFWDEKDEFEWEKKSEFASFYQDVKERYRTSGRKIADQKLIREEEEISAFVEKYMTLQAEYWIALLYLAYKKDAMDQMELVRMMKYDAHDKVQFFEEFEELAKTSSVQKKIQTISLNQENGTWRLDFSVLKTEFINFNLEMIMTGDDEVKTQVESWKTEIETERAKIREHKRRINELEQKIQEIEQNTKSVKEVEEKYVQAYIRERIKQEKENQGRFLAEENDFIQEFPWSWLHPIKEEKKGNK